MLAVDVALEALIQVREGRDFQMPAKVLARISTESANRGLPEFGVSLSTYVLHTDFWQVVWLNRLQGKRAPSFTEDWRAAPADGWPHVRQSFLKNLDHAVDLASARPFVHQMKEEDIAIRTLIQIAIHDAYHVGQFVLIKRALARLRKG